MGVAKLKKVRLYYHKSVQEDVAKTLQHSGVCQIIEEPSTELRETIFGRRLGLCEEQQTHLRYLFRTLENRYADPVSSIDRLLGEKPVLSATDLTRLARETDLEGLAAAVKKLEQKLNELRLEAAQARANETLLSHIRTFPYALDVLDTGTQTTKAVLGYLQRPQLESLKSALAAEFSAETELFVAPALPTAKEIWFVLFFSRTVEAQVAEISVRNGASFVELPMHWRGSVGDEMAALAARAIECEQQEALTAKELDEMAQTWMPTLQKLSDFWSFTQERYRAMCSCGTTDETTESCFWVPAEAWPALQKKIEALSPYTAFVVSDPTEEDNPPTLLKNRPAVQPFEVLTTLYSPPPYGELDPTAYLAPFFFIFFGMCLGDAGYGLVMLGVIALVFKKYRRIPKNVKDFIALFVLGAISTVVYGVLSGSFFGDFIDVFPFMAPLRSVKNFFMIVDPMGNPMQILGISLVLGLIHLMFGLGIAAYDCIRKKNYVDAVGDKISWILFIVGLALILMGLAAEVPAPIFVIAQLMALAGALIIFWYAGREKKGIFSKLFSGFLALYGSTSYLGDVLSYSRLLALGFGSAVVGMIVNLLGDMAAGIPYVGWVVAIAVIVGGHLFGILINLLGSFVHSLRLQYVEFFGKFYGGGGEPFTPLSISTQYVEVCEP